MGKQLLLVLVAFLASFDISMYATAKQRILGHLLAELGGKQDEPRGPLCEIKKAEDQCVNPGINNPPFCLNATCTFVPEYGEEITHFYQLFLPKFGKKKQYRRILDLGESATNSFEGVVCENENTVCGCKDSVHGCECDDEDDVKICKQQYTEKFGIYYVYKALFCEREEDPYSAFLKMLWGHSPPRHFSFSSQDKPYKPLYNQYSQTASPYSIFKYMLMLNKPKHHNLGELVLCKEQEKEHSYGKRPHSPYGYTRKPNYYASPYAQDYNTLVEQLLLKVEVPSGCECKLLKGGDNKHKVY